MKKVIDFSWEDNPVDVSAEVNFIWQVATLLHSVSYKDADHRDVILPMTVLRRLECALAPTKEKVVAYETQHPGTPDRKLERVAGLKFFNKSPWTLEKLLSVKTGQAQDLKDYIAGFSPNVKGIFAALKFELQIDEMAKKDVLNGVIKRYTEIDLSPGRVDSIKMGYIFEDLMRKFYENAEAGKQYTGRDIIRLMVSILMSEGADDIFEPGKVLTFLDLACGTAGMLSSSHSFVKHHNPEAQIFLYGQEYDDAAHAIAIAEMLIKGQDPQNIRCVDSLRTDCFPDLKARFVIENPPFGISWGGGDGELQKREDDVRAEHAKGERGRFPAGLPATGDSQLLFVQASVAKMDETCGRAAIIEHAGPLYSGDAGSGESEIRRWLLKKDLIEAIIALPVDMFYNTGLQTYIWILSKNKSRKRRGKVQLIDASSFCHPLRKKLGDKKNEITPADREAITKLYTDFKPGEFVKIFDNEDFLYREYTVMPPLQRRYEITNESVRNLIDGGYLSSIYNEKELHEVEARKAALKDGEKLSHKDEIKLLKNQDGRRVFSALVNDLFDHCSEKVWYEPKSFTEFVAKIVDPYTRYDKLIAKIVKGLSTPDPKAEIQRDKHGEIIYDTDLKDTEIVPYKESIDDYMAREVLPHMPGAKAFFLEDLKAKKPVIKTGAEFPFTRHFYKYAEPEPAEKIMKEIVSLDGEIASDFSALKKELA